MKYCLAQPEDAATVHNLMLQAFSVYRNSVPRPVLLMKR